MSSQILLAALQQITGRVNGKGVMDYTSREINFLPLMPKMAL